MWSGFKFQRQCHMWVEFVLGSPGISVFPSPQKPTLPNTCNTRTCLNKFIRTPQCFVSKQITIKNFKIKILKKVGVGCGGQIFIKIFKLSRWNMIIQNRSVVDSDWHFDNLCHGHLQSQSELFMSVYGTKIWLLTRFINN